MPNMYSIKTQGFYPADEEGQKPYVEAGSLPDDLKTISDEDYAAFFNPPTGYYGVFDDTGPHLEVVPEPDHAAENLLKAQEQYELASGKIDNLNDQIEDEDYSETDTEESVKASKVSWTTYRKALRAYIASTDGTKALPTAPDA